jgi:2-oxoisovalerate dehydrogenase E1 component alpha subunit
LMRQLKQSTAQAPISQGNSLISDAKLKQLYATMLKCSILDERAQEFKKRNKRSTQPFAGREAAIVSAAIDLRPDDWIAPPPRDFIGGLIKGIPLSTVWSSLIGPGTENRAYTGGTTPEKQALAHAHVVPPVASIALQLNLAAGIAIACKVQKNKSVTMAFLAGPLSSSRVVSETLTLAAAEQLPLVLVGYADYPLKSTAVRRRRSADLGDRSQKCEIPVIPVDGTDAVAIYRVACESIHKARYGGGPTMIEALPGFKANSRILHTGDLQTADSSSKMEHYLIAKGLFSTSWKQQLVARFNRELETVVKSEAITI